MIAVLRRATPGFLIVLLLLGAGCANRGGTGDFMKSVNSIRPGTSMDAVRKELGAPDVDRDGTMPANPTPGLLQATGDKVSPGARYRHWVYKRGDSHYHVAFARTTVQSGDRWEVVSVRSLPASTVY